MEVVEAKGAVMVRIEGTFPCQMHGWPGANAATEWPPNGADHRGVKLRPTAPPLIVGKRSHVALQIGESTLEIFIDGKKANSIDRSGGPA